MTVCMSFPTIRAFFSPKHPLNLNPNPNFSLSVKPLSGTSHLSNKIRMPSSSSSQTIEHVVLLKVKDDTDQSKVAAMIAGLNGLTSLDTILHLSAGPLLRIRSSYFNFTHILHARYKSKDDLNTYSQHPSHVSVAKESVLPIIDDIMAVDWVADDLQGPVSLPLGSALRVSFLKLKEALGEGAKSEVLEAIEGIKNSFSQIDQLSIGENFSPARAKGFSIASLAVFPGTSELEAVDSYQELVNSQKEKVRDYLDSVLVADYVVSLPQPASL